MPLHIGDISMSDDYCIVYKKKNETIAVCSPTKEDCKELFTWAAQQVELLPMP